MMSGFVNNLVLRHLETGNSVLPRYRGMFEPQIYSNTKFSGVRTDKVIAEEGFFENGARISQTVEKRGRYENVDPKVTKDNRNNGNTTDGLLRHTGGGTTVEEVKDAAFVDRTQDREQHEIPSSFNQKLTGEQQMDVGNTAFIAGSLMVPAAASRDESLDITGVTPGTSTRKSQHVQDKKGVIPGFNQDEIGKNRPVAGVQSTDTSRGSTREDLKSNDKTEIEPRKHKSKGITEDLSWLHDFKHALKQTDLRKEAQLKTAPIIKVNIGRIEVRAVQQSAPLTPLPKKETPKKSGMSLDEFLKQRNGGF